MRTVGMKYMYVSFKKLKQSKMAAWWIFALSERFF